MKIEIKTLIEKITLEFEDEEYFRKIHSEITEALLDDLNIKGVFYENDGSGLMLPALLLKNSIISIQKKADSSPLFS